MPPNQPEPLTSKIINHYMYQSGILPGKFMPFYEGHIVLINRARQQCRALTVLVCSGPDDPIPGWLRYAWVKNTFPDLDIRHVVASNTYAPGPDNESWGVGIETFRRIAPGNTDALFTSTANGVQLARALDIHHVLVDPERKSVPVSAGQVFNDPYRFWALIPDEVRPYFIRRVALLGPESSGKSYLARQLAERFNTVFVEEYARAYCEKVGMDLTDLDFAHIAGGQLYREDEMAKQASGILFCDTDLIVTQVWSEIFLKGKCQPWIFEANHNRRYDLFLLMAPDIPWVNDGLREYEHQRQLMFDRLWQELESRNLPYAIIKGGFETRTSTAIDVVTRRLGIAPPQ